MTTIADSNYRFDLEPKAIVPFGYECVKPEDLAKDRSNDYPS